MNIQDKSKEELVIELKELREAYDSLKASIKTDLPGCEHSEVALLKSRELLKTIEQAAKIGGWYFDVGTMVQTWTEEIFHILEIDTSHGAPDVPEGIGFIAPEYQPMALLGIQRAIEFGEPYNQEWEVITAKGNKRWINAIATPYQENGKTKYVSGSFQDITKRKQAEIALLRSEESLSTTLHSIGDGVISTDKNGLVIQMNMVAERLCGWQLAEAAGKPLADVFNIINAETRLLVADPVKKVLENGEIVGLANHTILVSKNGTEYQISDSAAPIKNKAGEITGVVLVFSDITGSYIAQKQIKESEERYRSLLNNLEAGIVVHAPDTSIVMNNHRASELLGLTDEQMKGKAAIDPAWKFIHEDHTPLTFDEYPVNRIVTGRQPIKNQVLGIRQPGKNDVVWVTANGFPVLDIKCEITEVVISFIDITDRMHAEEKIKLSEEKFSKSFFNSPDSIIINRLDDGKIVTVNNGFRKIMGYEESEVIGKTTTELNFYKTPGERNAIINALKTTGQALDIECWFITKQGEERLGLLSAAIIDIDGVKHIMSTSRDVTERRLVEEALKVSESRFRGFFDHSPLGINLFDLKGKVIAVNSLARKYFGVSESDPLSGYCLFDDPSVSDETKRKIKQGQIAMEERFIDFIAIRETGMYTSSKDETNKIFISLTYAAYGPYNENPTGIIVLIQDITDRKLAEEKLRQSEEQNKAIVLSTPDHIIMQDKHLKYNLVINPQMGLTEQDMLGKTDYDFLSKEDADNLTMSKTRVIETGETSHFETSLISASGKEEFFDGTFIPTFDAHAEPNGLIGYFRNVTERKQAELLLQEKTEEIEAQNEEYQQINEELNQTNQELAEARKKAEINVARMKMALEVSKSGAWDWDIQKNTFYWSDEFLEVFGLPENTIAGFESWTKALHPDDVERASTKIQEAIENHTELLNDYRIILPNNEIRWIRATGHATYVNNKPARIIGLCMDITYQKTADQELHNAKERAEESEKKYFSLFNEMINGFAYHKIILDENNNPCDYTFINVNPAFERLTGLKAKDIIGKTELEILPENDKYWTEIYGKVALTGESIQFENFASVLNKYFSVVAYCPEIGYFATIFEDITERKQKEIELQKAKDYAEVNNANITAIIEGTKENIWAFNKNYEILYFNKAFQTDFQQAFGISLEPGVNLIQSLPESIRPFWKLRYNRVLNNEQFTEEDAIDTGNEIIYVQVAFTPIVKKGEVIGGSCIGSNITSRKLAEQELINAKVKAEESEEFFRTIFENSPIGKSITGLDGSLKTNKAFSRMLGYSFEEFQTKNIYEITHPDDIQKTKEAIENLLSGEESIIQFEKKYVHKNGSVIFSEVVSTLQKNRDGKPLFFITSVSDITERKRSEKALKESEERFKNMFETHSSIMLLVEPESGMIIGANDASATYYGYSKSELLSMRIDQINILPPDEIKIQREQALCKVRSYFIFPHKLANGEVRTVEVHSSPIVFQDQKILFSIIHDISERMHLEKIREIQYAIATAAVTSDNVEQLLGFVRTQLSQLFDTTNFFAALYNAKNKTLKKLHWVDEVDDFEEWDATKSFSGYVVQTGQTLLINKQEIAKLGMEQNIPIIGKPAECWLGVPLIVAKKTIGVLVIQSYTDPKAYDASSAMLFKQIAHDLSTFIDKNTILKDLNVAKEHAEESDRLKSAFLANMSHEIRTPMNGILGFASLLTEPDLTGEDQQKYIRIIEKSGARMLNIINDIVDISKIEAGLMEVNLIESNINDQIEFIYTFFKPETEGKGMRLSFKNSLPEKEAIIKTDREKIYAVLTNLVKNAIKYSNLGSIDFGYDVVKTQHATSLQFFVKDTGIGIAKNRQKAIFERFIQADIEDPKALQGAGLGLTISKAYVEMLGGEIWVKSDEGIGSTFYFTIPYNTKKQEQSDIENIVSAEDIDFQIKKLKILIAEDDETSDFLITSMLKKNNNEVLHARTGIEVIEVCRKNPDLDLILMDIKMPNINGYEATHQIRQFNNEVIIIAQTSYGLSGDRQKAIDAGCNEYLSKPIRKDELLRLLQKYFQR